MKIFNNPAFASNFVSSLGSSFLLYGFTGEVPVDVNNIPFDVYDAHEIAAQAATILEVNASDDDQYVRFDNVACIKRPVGTAFDPSENKFRVCPTKVSFSEGFRDDLHQSIANTYGVDSKPLNSGNTNPTDHFYEFDFGQDVSIGHIKFKCYHDSRYVQGNFNLLRLVGETWELCEAVSSIVNVPSGEANAVLTQEYVATKFRIAYTVKPTYYQYIGGFNFYSDIEYATNPEKEDFTWFAAISYSNPYTDRPSVVIGNAGGPNGNKEVALTHYKGDSAEEIKLMNFKLKAMPFGEAV